MTENNVIKPKITEKIINEIYQEIDKLDDSVICFGMIFADRDDIVDAVLEVLKNNGFEVEEL